MNICITLRIYQHQKSNSVMKKVSKGMSCGQEKQDLTLSQGSLRVQKYHLVEIPSAR